MKAEYRFKTTIELDQKTGELFAVYFQVREGKAAHVEERNNGAVYVNYDKHGKLLGVEMLAPCSVTVLDKIAAKQPMMVRSRLKKYFRESAPRGMLVAN